MLSCLELAEVAQGAASVLNDWWYGLDSEKESLAHLETLITNYLTIPEDTSQIGDAGMFLITRDVCRHWRGKELRSEPVAKAIVRDVRERLIAIRAKGEKARRRELRTLQHFCLLLSSVARLHGEYDG